jgi:hypothetical protein
MPGKQNKKELQRFFRQLVTPHNQKGEVVMVKNDEKQNLLKVLKRGETQE